MNKAEIEQVQEALRQAPPATGRVLNFAGSAYRGRGHDITFQPVDQGGLSGTAWCWCTPGPQVGDQVLIANGARSSRYRIVGVRPCNDPPDMYHLDLIFDPRGAN